MNAMKYVRTKILRLSQARFAQVVQYEHANAIVFQERSEVDKMTVIQLRRCRNYALANDIPWPDDLANRIVAGDLVDEKEPA